MNVCTSIAQFPTQGAYVLADQDPPHRQVGRLIDKFRPGLNNLGVLNHDALPPAGAYVIVAGSPWRGRLERLEQLGVPADHIVLFVPPAGDYCGFIDFFEPLMEHIHCDGPGFTIGWEHVHRRMRENRAGAIGKLGRMLLEPDRCYCSRPPRDGEWDAMRRVAATMDASQAQAYLDICKINPHAWVDRFVNRAFNHVQYFDHIRLGEGSVVINCGLANGWEMPMLLARLGRGGRVYCIDPTGERYLAEIPKAAIAEYRDQVILVEKALSDFEGRIGGTIKDEMAFVGKGSAADHNHNSDDFPCTTLDRLAGELELDRIDLIKMDIEGSESDALRGMVETLRRFRPQLAISIYHRPEDLWELSDFILGLVDDYVTFVESYSYNRSDTIGYLIPKERLGEPPSWGIAGVPPQPIHIEVEGRFMSQAAWVAKWLMGRRG